ncbi:hypothetical protein [Bryocella elongata]|uniref:hypothetical protein n=1 Tax=Bryocella elongata TaxID=863522 RepID=UPI001F3838D8|nr:hypothetical protein [Bryocella elongata]
MQQVDRVSTKGFFRHNGGARACGNLMAEFSYGTNHVAWLLELIQEARHQLSISANWGENDGTSF